MGVSAGSFFEDFSQEVQVDQTLPISSRESFTWIIPKTILCLVDWTSRVLVVFFFHLVVEILRVYHLSFGMFFFSLELFFFGFK